jgi:hypothetical protein
MKPQTIGRALGIGMRVAGRMAGQRLAGNAQAAVARPVTIEGVTDPARARATGTTAGRATGSLARGIGGFLRPFGRVGSKIVLEVAGLFFFIFVLVFGQTVFRARASYLHGPDHEKFLVGTALMLLFLYLSVSSFWRARRK